MLGPQLMALLLEVVQPCWRNYIFRGGAGGSTSLGVGLEEYITSGAGRSTSQGMGSGTFFSEQIYEISGIQLTKHS